jgi:CRP-like cAMP-binding protein
MDLSKIFDSISRIIALDDKEKDIFVSLVELISIKRNDTLLRQGQRCVYEYFILKGCLRSYYFDENSIEHTTLFAVEGWWTGNLKSFVKNTPSEFNIQALEDSVLIRISKSNMEALYDKIPKLNTYFRILLQNRLIATQDRVSRHLSEAASTRYLQFITMYPDLEQRVPAKHIASYLGITPTYLSRLRKKRLSNRL